MVSRFLGVVVLGFWLTGCLAGHMAAATLMQAGTAAGVGLVGNAVMQPLMQPLMPKQQQMPVQQAVTRNCKEMPDGTEECTKTYTTISIVPQQAANSPPTSRSSPPGVQERGPVSVEKDPCTDWANRAFYKGCWGKK